MLRAEFACTQSENTNNFERLSIWQIFSHLIDFVVNYGCYLVFQENIDFQMTGEKKKKERIFETISDIQAITKKKMDEWVKYILTLEHNLYQITN